MIANAPTPLCLTDDEIDERLMGEPLAPVSAAHLQNCEFCQARVAEAEAAIGSFASMSLAWAERRSATMPLRPEGLRTHANPGRRMAWASVATAVLAVGIAIPVLHERLARKDAPAPAETQSMAAMGHTGMKSVTPVASSPDVVAHDNQMLQQIDQALDAPATETAASYGLDPVEGHAHTRARVRD